MNDPLFRNIEGEKCRIGWRCPWLPRFVHTLFVVLYVYPMLFLMLAYALLEISM
jgi:hypothetical protein